MGARARNGPYTRGQTLDGTRHGKPCARTGDGIPTVSHIHGSYRMIKLPLRSGAEWVENLLAHFICFPSGGYLNLIIDGSEMKKNTALARYCTGHTQARTRWLNTVQPLFPLSCLIFFNAQIKIQLHVKLALWYPETGTLVSGFRHFPSFDQTHNVGSLLLVVKKCTSNTTRHLRRYRKIARRWMKCDAALRSAASVRQW